jgi:thiol:disulfide interchange protein/DsbC/DsbD-like thiol-disulfide interchange protein
MRIGRVLGGVLAGLAAAVASAAPAYAASPTALTDPVAARIVPEARAIVPGGTLWVDLHLDIAPGWHTYWRNPGDAGLPTEIAWDLPAGFSAGEIAWPAPERFVLGTIGNYGYQGSTDLLVQIAAPADLEPGGTVHLAANASWLVCSEICIPGEAKLALDLPVGATAPPGDPSAAALFAAVRDRLPKTATWKPRFTASARNLRLFVPTAALAGIERPTAAFFPLDGNVVDAAAEPKEEEGADGLALVLARMSGPASATLPTTLSGVIVLRGVDGTERAYSISAPRAAAGDVTGSLDGEPGVGWWGALMLAAVGGILLNLMPCVFPILSLKLLGLAGSAHRAEQWPHGIAYALGVILSFALLGGVLLVLRAGGAAIGWGFQLQSPVVVGLLAYLLLAMGLSLSGVAEFGTGLTGAGSRFAGGAGLAGAFATGILATIVATPCTAPFMGAALGVALIAPAPVALAIFVALGIGLALPFVLATAIPGIARRLPRPGRWMEWFKQLLAFPLYGTVAWLIWVLIQEVGPAGAFAGLLGLVVVGFAVWIYGRTRAIGPLGRRLGAGFALTGVAAALVLAAMPATPGQVAAEVTGEAAPAEPDNFGYRPFSSARLDRLVAEHQPVFVNLTAAWCITCLVNEHTTLDSRAVRRAFAERGIVALKGDWTRQNPEITTYLQEFGRSGVPLYLLYDTAGRPTILPQILTEAAVLAALGKIQKPG